MTNIAKDSFVVIMNSKFAYGTRIFHTLWHTNKLIN